MLDVPLHPGERIAQVRDLPLALVSEPPEQIDGEAGAAAQDIAPRIVGDQPPVVLLLGPQGAELALVGVQCGQGRARAGVRHFNASMATAMFSASCFG